MKSHFNHYLLELKANPKRIFIIDGLGALISFFLLFFVLRNLHEYIGLSPDILTYLSIFALCLLSFSVGCFFFLTSHWSSFIKLLSLGNIAYCIFSFSILIHFYAELTSIGLFYFINEKVIVLALAYFEYKLVKSFDR